MKDVITLMILTPAEKPVMMIQLQDDKGHDDAAAAAASAGDDDDDDVSAKFEQSRK